MVQKTIKKVEKSLASGASKAILEELFQDFNRNRFQVYKMNFIRGIFFGLGSVLGGTVVITLIIWLLSLFADIPGGIGHFISDVVSSVENKR